MIRALCIAAAAASAFASAAARAGDRCATATSFTGQRHLSVVLVPDHEFGYRVLAPTPNSSFPAISSDGATLVDFFQEGHDFSGAPITMLVFWSTATGKRTDEIGLDGGQSADQSAKILATANVRLGRSTWRGVDVYTPCHLDPAGVGRAVQTALGTIDVAGTPPVLRHGAAHIALEAPGYRSGEDPDTAGSPCGTIRGIERAFGTAKLVVVVPVGMLGGDSCVGRPPSELATAVR